MSLEATSDGWGGGGTLAVEAGLGRPFAAASCACFAAAFAAALALRFCFFGLTCGAGWASEEGGGWAADVPPLDDAVVVGDGCAGGVDVEDLGTSMYLVPSLFVYFAVAFGCAEACGGCLLLAGIPEVVYVAKLVGLM